MKVDGSFLNCGGWTPVSGEWFGEVVCVTASSAAITEYTWCPLCRNLILEVDYLEHRLNHFNERIGQFFKGWKRPAQDQYLKDNDGA